MTTNSKTHLNQATHIPIQIGEHDAKDMAVPKFGLVKSLQLQTEERDYLSELVSSGDAQLQEMAPTLNAIKEEFNNDDESSIMGQLELAGELNFDHLANMGELVLGYRKQIASDLESEISLFEEFYQSLQTTPDPEPILNSDPPVEDPIIPDPNSGPVLLEDPIYPTPEILIEGELQVVPEISLGSMLDWMDQQGHGVAEAGSIRMKLRILDLSPDLPPAQYQQAIGYSLEKLKKILEAFKTGLKVQPYGILHLERMEFTPVGTERGELIQNFPLSPQESLTYTVKETDTAIQSLDETINKEQERTVEEKGMHQNSIDHTLDIQNKVNHDFDIAAKIYGKYGISKSSHLGFNVDTSYKFKSLLDEKNTFNAKQSQELTRTATDRAKSIHTQNFKVSATSVSDQTTVRSIRNPYPNRTMRVDYFSMMRKWKIDLLRYGLRITYDINVPEPGSEIMDKYRQIQEIDAFLEMPFEAYFTLPFSEIEQAWNYNTLFWESELNKKIQRFGVQAPRRPENRKELRKTEVRSWANKHEAEREEVIQFKFKKDPRYKVVQKPGSQKFYFTSDQHVHKDLTGPKFDLIEVRESEDLEFIILEGTRKNLGSLRVKVAAWELMQITSKAKSDWNKKTYQTIQDAAQAQFDRLKNKGADAKARLIRELGGNDTLSLRRLEREELMKNVLRWMFGPGFRFILPGMKAYNPTNKSANVDTYYDPVSRAVRKDEESFSLHQTVLQHGELIKFLHQAVEWENMSYFLYPYFWSAPNEWRQKLKLQHPDSTHEAFLKAGSARVVLPIRPGFEEKFLWFLKNGKLEIPESGAKPSYITLAQEMAAYANTNYPWLRSANPENSIRPQLTYRQRKAWGEMEDIIGWIEEYKKLNNTYPSNLAQLDTLPIPPSPAMAGRKDPWGEDYHYAFPGKHSDFDLASWGANKARGINPATNPADPEEEDITSWAEASLISTWYDYTPTNAMDIAIQTQEIGPLPPTPPTP